MTTFAPIGFEPKSENEKRILSSLNMLPLVLEDLREEIEAMVAAIPRSGGGSASSISPANPTASVGLAAVNGAATTYMRSDAAPALNVGISPTWTGSHTFTLGVSMSSTLGVSGNLTNTVLAGAGTRLVTSTSAGLLGNATTIAGAYTWSNAATFSSTISANGTITGSASGTGVASAFVAASTIASYAWNEIDAGSDAKIWDVVANSETLAFRTRTDAGGTGASWLTVGRTATAITSIALAGPVSMSSTLSVTGAQTNSNDITLSRSNAGGNATLTVANSSNTASSRARVLIQTAGSTADDPFISFNRVGDNTYSIGYDASAGRFVVSNATSLGTQNILSASVSTVDIPIAFSVTGTTTLASLAGTGTRLVTASSTGLLAASTAAAFGLVSGSAATNQVAVFSSASAIGGSGNLTFDGSTLALTGSQTISSLLTVSGLVTASAGVTIAGGAAAAGKLSRDATNGLVVRGASGSSADLTLMSAGGQTYLVGEASGSGVTFPGAVLASGALTNSALAGTGDRLVTSNLVGTLGNATNIYHSYYFSTLEAGQFKYGGRTAGSVLYVDSAGDIVSDDDILFYEDLSPKLFAVGGRIQADDILAGSADPFTYEEGTFDIEGWSGDFFDPAFPLAIGPVYYVRSGKQVTIEIPEGIFGIGTSGGTGQCRFIGIPEELRPVRRQNVAVEHVIDNYDMIGGSPDTFCGVVTIYTEADISGGMFEVLKRTSLTAAPSGGFSNSTSLRKGIGPITFTYLLT